jgi:hypothetical protein
MGNQCAPGPHVSIRNLDREKNMQLLKRLRLLSVAALAAVVAIGSVASANPLTIGDLVVYQTGPLVPNAALANSGTPINIIELSATQAAQSSPIQTFSISTQGSPLFTSGTASSTGYLRSNPAAGGVITFTGHTSSTAAGTNENTVTGRAVGVIDLSGNYSVGTTYTGASGNQTRSAITNNGSDFYIGDQGGIYGNGNTSAELAANVRNMGSFGGQTFALQASTTAAQVSSVSPTGPQNSGPVTLTALPGIGANSNAQDFYMLSSGTQGSLIDTLYVSTTTGLSKFSFDGTTWTARGTATVTGGAYGLAAQADPVSGVDLYVTTGNGTGTNVVSVNDSAAFNSNITLGAATTLYTVPGGTTATFRGIALVQAAATPEPASLSLLVMAGAGLLARRRAKTA